MAIIGTPTQAMLTDAEAAYHRLLTGTAPRVVVDQNGERVEYSQANKADLGRYVVELRAALGRLANQPGFNPGPVQFTF